MAYNAMPGEDGPCLCDPCVCDHDCGISPMYKSQERGGEMGEDQVCRCDPCECETPPGSPSKSKMNLDDGAGDGNPYQLDEFARAKEFFMNTSTKSGLCMYEHLVQVIRKILDERGPMNPVDYLEEVSMNVKRYKFQIPKDIIRDVFQISPPLLDDARYLTSHWKRVNRYIGSEFEGEDGEEDYSQGYVGGSFQNLLRLAYYLEQISIGLPREEMFRLAIAIRELTVSRPYITRARFWGKIFGIRKGYYVVETEFRTTDSGIGDLWAEPDNSNGEMEGEGQEIMAIEEQKLEGVTAEDLNSEEILGAQKTLMRAGNVVLDTDFLSPYSKTSGLPPEKIAQLLPKAKNADDFQPLPEQKPLGLEYGGEGYMMNMSEMVGEGGAPIQLEDTEALEDAAKWHGFMEEFMSNFPQAFIEPEVTVPAEPMGTGINRRAFYVCSSLGEPWILLPISTPELLNGSRNIRWALTGELNAPIRSYPEYPGKEAHYLRSLLARAAAGSLASPKGFYRPSAFPGEYPGEDEEDVEEEEESLNAPGEDKVNQVKKYDVSLNLITNPNLDFWVHHATYILPQGRATWWNPMSLNKPPKKKSFDEDEDDEDEDEDEYDEFEGEEDVPATNAPGRELGPPLFTPISSDTSIDGRKPWTLSTSTSIFLEFQVVSIRSNTWPGSTCICTMKGKVDNIYFGDGLKFADRTYCPAPPPPSAAEYKFGPEISEISDPTVEEEQDWLNKLELSQIADIEPKFEDNEVVGEDEEEEETEYESDDDY